MHTRLSSSSILHPVWHLPQHRRNSISFNYVWGFYNNVHRKKMGVVKMSQNLVLRPYHVPHSSFQSSKTLFLVMRPYLVPPSLQHWNEVSALEPCSTFLVPRSRGFSSGTNSSGKVSALERGFRLKWLT